MKLQSFRVKNYKCIEDSHLVSLDNITCLVGKNESGKTALLEALAKLNPCGPIDSEFVLEDYPRRKLTHYKRTHENEPETPITATFILSDSEVKVLEEEFGKGFLKETNITITKNYKNEKIWNIPYSEKVYVSKVLSEYDIPEDYAKELRKSHTIKELLEKSKAIQDPTDTIKKLIQDFKEWNDNSLLQKVLPFLKLPKFFYFDEYATLRGEIHLKQLKQKIDTHKKSKTKLDENDCTASSLINLADAQIEDFLDQKNYERLKANLEACSNSITDQIFKYWTQNKHLEVEFDLHPKLNPSNQLEDTILFIRIKNTKHRATVSFDKRSRGFVWFFSFLVAFSEHVDSEENIILLLDEPGLNLHAKAQGDLLKYIEDNLAQTHQVIYTTHSPFMIDSHQFGRVRTVEDTEATGTVVSDDPLRSDSDTVFPLQTALGYKLAQTLFLGPTNLLVEGPSDLIYLTTASDLLKEQGKVALREDCVIVPVGGADKLSTFISLLGANQLTVGVLMDISNKDQQRIQNLIQNEHLKKTNLFTYAEVVGQKEADIEDIFDEKTYLELVHTAYAPELKGKKPNYEKGHPRILERIKKAFREAGVTSDGEFSHYRPARLLLRKPELIETLYTGEVLKKYETLFNEINKRLK